MLSSVMSTQLLVETFRTNSSIQLFGPLQGGFDPLFSEHYPSEDEPVLRPDAKGPQLWSSPSLVLNRMSEEDRRHVY